MKNKFILGILCGFTIPLLIIAVFSLLFLSYGINQENMDYKSSYAFVDGKSILEKHKDVIVVVLSTGCPGKVETTPFLKEKIEYFRKHNIAYILVADEIYNDNVDNKLDNFKKEFVLNDEIFLMDKNKYLSNSGFFNVKNRYKEFVFDLCKTNENFPFGYAVYIFIKDGKYVNCFGLDLTDKDLEVYKKATAKN